MKTEQRAQWLAHLAAFETRQHAQVLFAVLQDPQAAPGQPALRFTYVAQPSALPGKQVRETWLIGEATGARSVEVVGLQVSGIPACQNFDLPVLLTAQ